MKRPLRDLELAIYLKTLITGNPGFQEAFPDLSGAPGEFF